MNRRGGQTDIWLQGKKEVLKSRRERSRATHLLVLEVGHPDGLGQPCILTLLQGLGRRGGEQLNGMLEQK